MTPHAPEYQRPPTAVDGQPHAGDPVSDRNILNDIGRKRTGGPLDPVYLGVMDKESYRGVDGRKHIKLAPAWLPKDAAHAFILANEELAQRGKRIILASEGSGNSQINSAGRTKTQQAIATGLHAAPGHSNHEHEGALDIRNFADPDVMRTVLKYGFQRGDHGMPIARDEWHFSFKPAAARLIAQLWSQREKRLAGQTL